MHYSVHDGPGIRTTVFFKGCPLSCIWCHNPESLDFKPQQVFYPHKCIKCGKCAEGLEGHGEVCPSGAKETIGYEVTVPKLMEEIKKDLLFFEQSGGGVTFSGGEPFFQGDFLYEILEKCRDDYINTAIDTSGHCDSGLLLKAAEMANYILYDVKFIDSKKHEKYCGAPNDLILENLKLLSGMKKGRPRILIRIPVVPGLNDDPAEMKGIFDYIKGLNGIEIVHLLPYHNIQGDKYKRLGMKYELDELPGDESPNMKELLEIFSKKFRTKVGG